MNRLILILLLTFTFALKAEEKPLAAYLAQDSIWHFIDYSGKEIFDPVFIIEVAGYSEEVFRVQTVVHDTIRWCFLNHNGEVVILPHADMVLDFKNGMAFTVKVINEKGDQRYGFINRRGEQVIPSTNIDATQFSEGLAFLRNDEKRGYIDTSGKFVFEMDSLVGYDFTEGLAPVSNSEYLVGFIDRKGEIVIPLQYDEPAEFTENLAPVTTLGNFGYIDQTGTRVIPFKFHVAKNFYEDRAFVGMIDIEKITHWAMIDPLGNLLTNYNYIHTRDFNEGKAAVMEKNLWGYINSDAKYVIEPQYRFAHNFKDGLAFAADTEGNFGYINEKGDYEIKIENPVKVVDFRFNTRVY